MLFADVMVERSGKQAVFTYSVPEIVQNVVTIGTAVTVPVRSKIVYGVVWNLPSKTRPHRRIPIKPITKVIDPDLRLMPYQKDLSTWISERFMAPLAACVFCFLPIMRKRSKEQNIGNRISNIATAPKFPTRGEPAESILNSKFSLTSDQQHALNIIEMSSKPVLLHGITGSGKTEVYLRYAEEIMKSGKQVLMLVPEIALTPQTRKRFEERFGGIVAVWHSELSAAERRAIWWQVHDGTRRLVVGSRSAIFLPFEQLGLIVIDEEHEKTYYQESAPRYDARVLAEQMHRTLGLKLIVGSATPSLESVWKASNGQYELARLNNRIHQAALPESVIIDLKQERLGEGQFLSHSLLQELEQTVRDGRQAVLLLNRRGHSTTALCTTCGHIVLCKNCNVPMTVHNVDKTDITDKDKESFKKFRNSKFEIRNSAASLQCHHCGHTEPAMALCPYCKAPTIVFRGFGTEKVESEIARIMPQARILRMDRDTTASRSIIDTMYHDFAAGRYDILVGTQMIAKGWDIPAVDLVGIVLAEGGLMLPDYHAAANTFNLLVQVAGRSGRGKHAGKTIIQTYQPDHPLIRAAALHDFGLFAKTELKFRQQFHYPPFSHIVRFLYQHRDKQKCHEATVDLARILESQLDQKQAEILGPAACFFERLRGKYRYHIIVKVLDPETLPDTRSIATQLAAPWVVEVDPTQLL